MDNLRHGGRVLAGSRFSLDELSSELGCRKALAQLIAMSNEELAWEDIGLVNLLCAVGLPSADPLDIPQSLARLDELAEYARHEIIKGYPGYVANPNPRKGSEAVYKLWAVMHAVRIKSGIEMKYERATANEIADREFSDASVRPTGGPYKSRVNSQVCFVHGLLSPRCLGSCASNPVLFAAIGRRLGYPVRLVLTPNHIFNRWVDDNEQFNMDGSMKCIGGDEYHHYVDRWRPWLDWERRSTAFHRPLTPREELATFMFNRCNCESANLRFDAALKSCKIAARLQPDHQAYIDEQWIIQQNQMITPPSERPTFAQLFWHKPEIVTAAGCFSVKQIKF